MYHLLVVDDEAQIRTLIRKYAEFAGYRVSEATNGMEAVEMVRANRYDLVIMDIMMPELDGLSACREIRNLSSVPVIMLSARGEEYDKISGFECGADDYVTKPFSPRELMLRVEVVLKRTGATTEAEKYVDGGLVIDMTRRHVTVDGVAADLSPREYDLLFYLVRNANTALSRETLLRDVWGSAFEGNERTLDTHVKLLRQSLGAYSGHIVTLRGVGYRFDA
jgi:DNA-binding response OmpR family regulator